MEKDNALKSLLDRDVNARQYFHSLPDYAKDQIRTRPQGVDSFETLRAYGEKLLQGDD